MRRMNNCAALLVQEQKNKGPLLPNQCIPLRIQITAALVSQILFQMKSYCIHFSSDKLIISSGTTCTHSSIKLEDCNIRHSFHTFVFIAFLCIDFLRRLLPAGIYLLNQLGLLSIATILAVVNQIILRQQKSLLPSIFSNGATDRPLFPPRPRDQAELLSMEASEPDLPHLRPSALRTHLPSRPFLYRRVGVLLDRLEFCLYLALSAVNGIVCLFVMPAFDDSSETRRQRYETRLGTI